jgi:hypothetical protein
MIEQWVKPVYRQVDVNGECTAYAGGKREATPPESASAGRTLAVRSGNEEAAQEMPR